jgi:hypothetical protein
MSEQTQLPELSRKKIPMPIFAVDPKLDGSMLHFIFTKALVWSN